MVFNGTDSVLTAIAVTRIDAFSGTTGIHVTLVGRLTVGVSIRTHSRIVTFFRIGVSNLVRGTLALEASSGGMALRTRMAWVVSAKVNTFAFRSRVASISRFARARRPVSLSNTDGVRAACRLARIFAFVIDAGVSFRTPIVFETLDADASVRRCRVRNVKSGWTLTGGGMVAWDADGIGPTGMQLTNLETLEDPVFVTVANFVQITVFVLATLVEIHRSASFSAVGSTGEPGFAAAVRFAVHHNTLGVLGLAVEFDAWTDALLDADVIDAALVFELEAVVVFLTLGRRFGDTASLEIIGVAVVTVQTGARWSFIFRNASSARSAGNTVAVAGIDASQIS